jgi:hypothetical protein
MDIEQALKLQSDAIVAVAAQLGALTIAVQSLIQLIHEEDMDPEGAPELTLDGEAGSSPRRAGVDLG